MSSSADAHPTPYAGFDRLFIAGAWRPGGAEPRPDRNPWTGETLLDAPQADARDVDRAYAAAAAAQSDWSGRLPADRARIFARAAALLEGRREEIMDWLVRESGSTRLKAALEVKAVQGVFLEAASLPYLVEGRILPNDAPGKESRVYRRPVGVVGVISPWNWPLQLSARSIAPAMAVGNAVVLKPATDTPITGGLLFAKLFEEAGLPEGVLNVVPGSGGEIGEAFVKHDAPRVISFTGSTPVGRGVARQAVEADVIKRVELELGGDSPLVVLADADLNLAVEAAVWGKFLHQGQICMIANRVIVEAPVREEFLSRFVDRVASLKVGDPRADDAFIGPIINESQMKGLKALIERARGAGLTERLGGDADGLVLPPHVYEAPEDSPFRRQEIFGPIAPVLTARDEADALRLANDTDYGLSSSVFTRDLEKGARFARALRAGMSHVNDQPVNDLPFSPFGGERNSGLGRFNGRWAVDAFTTDHWISLQHDPRRYPFSTRDLQPQPAESAGG